MYSHARCETRRHAAEAACLILGCQPVFSKRKLHDQGAQSTARCAVRLVNSARPTKDLFVSCVSDCCSMTHSLAMPASICGHKRTNRHTDKGRHMACVFIAGLRDMPVFVLFHKQGGNNSLACIQCRLERDAEKHAMQTDMQPIWTPANAPPHQQSADELARALQTWCEPLIVPCACCLHCTHQAGLPANREALSFSDSALTDTCGCLFKPQMSCLHHTTSLLSHPPQ